MQRLVFQYLVLLFFFIVLRNIFPPRYFLSIAPTPSWLQSICSSIHDFLHLVFLIFISIVLLLVVLLLYLHHSFSYYHPPPPFLSLNHCNGISIPTTTSVASSCPPLRTNHNQQETQPRLTLKKDGTYSREHHRNSNSANPCLTFHGTEEGQSHLGNDERLPHLGKDEPQPHLTMKKDGNKYSHEHHRNSIHANPGFHGKNESQLQQQKDTRNHLDHAVSSSSAASRSRSRSRVYEHAPSDHSPHPSASNHNNIGHSIPQNIPRKNRSYSRHEIESGEVNEYRHIYDDLPVKSITDSSVNHSSSLVRAKQQHNMLPPKSAHPKKPLFVAQRESFQGGRPVIKAPEHYAGDFGACQDADNKRCVDGTASTHSDNITAGTRTAGRSRSTTADNSSMGTMANSDAGVWRSCTDGLKHGSEHTERNRWADQASDHGESGNRASSEGEEQEKTRCADGKVGEKMGKGKMERSKSGRGYDPRQDAAEEQVARSYGRSGEGNKRTRNSKNGHGVVVVVVDNDNDNDNDDDGYHHHDYESLMEEMEQRSGEEQEQEHRVQDKKYTDFIAIMKARQRAEEAL